MLQEKEAQAEQLGVWYPQGEGPPLPRELEAPGQIQTACWAPPPCHHGAQLIPPSDSPEGARPTPGEKLSLGHSLHNCPALSIPATPRLFPGSAHQTITVRGFRQGWGMGQPGSAGPLRLHISAPHNIFRGLIRRHRERIPTASLAKRSKKV